MPRPPQDIPLHPPRAVAALGLASWALLAWVFACWDLDLSVAFADPSSGWGAFVARWGELPGVAVVSVAVFLLAAARLGGPAAPRALAALGATVGCAGLATYGVGVLVAREGWAAYLAGGGLGIALGAATATASCLWLARRRGIVLSARVVRFARVTVATALVALAVVMALKLLWGRVRFRDLEAGYEAFSPWYAPQGPTGHSSFPSGHTLWGWLVLPAAMLVPRAWPWRRWAVVALAVGWGLAVAAGRVLLGAHYASDVLFSTAIVFAALRCVSRGAAGTASAREHRGAPSG